MFNLLTPNNQTTVRLYIYDEIGEYGVSAADVASFIDALPDSVQEIELRINSPGGSVFEGYAIFNLLRDSGLRIVAKIDGLAASIATVIALAADEVVMGETAMWMIHEAWTISIGSASALREDAERLDQLTQQIIALYSKATGESQEAITESISNGKEVWLTSQEAVDAGYASYVLRAGDDAPQLNIPKGLFKNAPTEQPPKEKSIATDAAKAQAIRTSVESLVLAELAKFK